MGNDVSSCLNPPTTSEVVKLVFWGGATRVLHEPTIKAGKLMFQFPDHIVCHADSFYIGHPIPVVAIDEDLVLGETYFVLPLDRFPCSVLTAASLSALSNGPRGSPLNFGQCPFEYVKGAQGTMHIRVLPEFITRIISGECQNNCSGSSSKKICSTPELQKHYTQLVGTREQAWSPKLETISERKARSSPCRLLGCYT